MAEEADLRRENPLTSLLAAYDNQLAAGTALPSLPESWQTDVELLRLLHQLRPGKSSLLSPSPPTNDTSAPGEERYELLRPHASGGIGHVWVARDADLGRDVALKELKPERAADPAMIARFLHEARITGRLQHPGIVPVYELVPGDGDEPPFYTMRLVRGQTLTEAARTYHRQRGEGRAKRIDFLRLLHAFLSVCNTVAYAHTRGVIHRDLKGQNVILGDFGEVIVLDWGFAKMLSTASGGRQPPVEPEQGANSPRSPEIDTDSSPEQTQAGQMLGTPAYMAPEQAQGRLTCLDDRTDVFGLGAILYEILTGQPPFAGDTAAESLRKARAGQPPLPQALNPGVPPALAAVCRRAMAHEPAERYSSAADLAQELQRWLADEPVQAYPEPWSARCLRWMRRHRIAVAIVLAALVTISLLSGLGLAVIGEARSRTAQTKARIEAESSKDLARRDEVVKRRLDEQIYFQNIALAERELVAKNLPRVDKILNNSGPANLRGWEWNYLLRRCWEEPRALKGHQATVSAVAFSPDGRLLASASHDQTLKLWNAATGQERFTLRGHGDVVADTAFSPDGRMLASAGWDSTIRLWDSETGRFLRSFDREGRRINRLAFSPEGRHLAAVSDDRLVIRDVEQGTIVGSFQAEAGQRCYRVAYHPKGTFLALTTSAGVYLFDGSKSFMLRRFAMPNEYVKCLALSPDGELLATGEGDLAYGSPGLVRLWQVSNGSLLATFEAHTEPIFALAFNADGTRLFSASQDKTVKVWDVPHRQEALTLRSHTDTVTSLALSADSSWLATAGADGLVRLWNATPLQSRLSPYERRRLEGHRGDAFAATFTPDGRRILSLGLQGDFKTWDAASGQLLVSFGEARTPGVCFSLTLSPDGRSAATAKSNGEVLLYDVATGRLLRRFLGHSPGPIKSVAFSPDGQRLASAGWNDRTVRVWPVKGGEPLVLRGHQEAVLGVAFGPDGQRIASAGYDKTVRLWDAASGRCLRVLHGHASRVHKVAFSHSGRLLASAGNDLIRIWNLDQGELQTELSGHTSGVNAAVFSPDDRFLASAASDGTVRLWDIEAARELSILHGHDGAVHSVGFSPDGRWLCSAGHDHTVRIWELDLPR